MELGAFSENGVSHPSCLLLPPPVSDGFLHVHVRRLLGVWGLELKFVGIV